VLIQLANEGGVFLFELDFRSRLPIYEQLINKIKELIIAEVLKPDEQLPPVRNLAAELTVNPNTIQKAYRELEHQGFIYSIPGKGSFVMPNINGRSSPRVEILKKELGQIAAELCYLGLSQEEIIAFIKDHLKDHLKGGIKGND